MPLEFRVVPHNSQEYWDAVELRRCVLRVPLGLNFLPEELDAESEHLHLIGEDDGDIIACLILQPLAERTIKMRQVAVKSSQQGKGIGAELVRFSEAAALHYGFAEIILHARASDVPFYLKLGYETESEPFEEAAISHCVMKKSLLEMESSRLLP